MSLLSESLVEEWLNRAGYFTIRGVRYGVSEIDLLAVRHTAQGIDARHVEVQISTNPISYISPLTKEQSKVLGKNRTSSWTRPSNVLEESISAWLEKKFYSRSKEAAREKVWPGLKWSLEFVHGEVRHQAELEAIRAGGINTISFFTVLSSLCHDPATAYKGGAGTDIAEMLSYYVWHKESCGSD
ncbi:hypothetical protein [Nitrosomonas ureae]|uniref:Uncharacterized protein n=1 Tax=Nitrosomonas ureae TaxID=44577 RepID=A0A1H5WPC7_9PROT|nr:hypothetical protein [Nitrosomonas ureae]SEG01106.1 hypothetical protein SAMN05216334_12027 [Nitrosomonas ureae]